MYVHWRFPETCIYYLKEVTLSVIPFKWIPILVIEFMTEWFNHWITNVNRTSLHSNYNPPQYSNWQSIDNVITENFVNCTEIFEALYERLRY